MTLLIVFCAGCVLALVANVFALMAASGVCAVVYLFELIAMGSAHPILATAAAIAASQVGYGLGMLVTARLPPDVIIISHGPGEARRPGAKGRGFLCWGARKHRSAARPGLLANKKRKAPNVGRP